MKLFISVVLLSLASSAGFASSQSAWEKHDQEVMQQCSGASKLKNIQPVGDVLKYDDTVGLDAVLLRGDYPQKHMKGKKGAELCLFDRKKNVAFITEANTLIKK